MSWKLKSNATLANIRPVKPPKTKHEIKFLQLQMINLWNLFFVKANDQANIFTAVGTPITNVAHENKFE